MQAGAFIDQSLKTDDVDQLFDLYCTAMAELGVNRIIYGSLNNAPDDETTIPGIESSYPEDWVRYYFEQDYLNIDPVCTKARLTRQAFTWKDMMAERRLGSHELLVMNQGQEAGLNDGVGMAFHGPFGEAFGVGLASTDSNPDIGHFLPQIEALSTQFHVSYSALYTPPLPQTPQLSARETEVLKWVAAGKSNWAIGEILSISEHGVDYHMRNILRKLDADSRLNAVVKALYLGLIRL